MRKILMVLILITAQIMGEVVQNFENTLTQEERFEMLFGKTVVHLRRVVQSRPSRVARNTRVPELKMAPTVEEKQKLCSRERMTYHRKNRTAREALSRESRQSIYITLNY